VFASDGHLFDRNKLLRMSVIQNKLQSIYCSVTNENIKKYQKTVKPKVVHINILSNISTDISRFGGCIAFISEEVVNPLKFLTALGQNLLTLLLIYGFVFFFISWYFMDTVSHAY
jgi:hypothetical protein